MRPDFTTVMFDISNITFNIGPFLFDHHIDTTPGVLASCRSNAAGNPARLHLFEGVPEYFSTITADAEPVSRASIGVPEDAFMGVTVGALYKLNKPLNAMAIGSTSWASAPIRRASSKRRMST
jgi:hypothetical protein